MKKGEAVNLMGWLLLVAGVLLLVGNQPLTVPANASYNTTASVDEPPSRNGYIGWGMVLLGFLTLGSNHYFKLRGARRADRAEAREVHDRRRNNDDVR